MIESYIVEYQYLQNNIYQLIIRVFGADFKYNPGQYIKLNLSSTISPLFLSVADCIKRQSSKDLVFYIKDEQKKYYKFFSNSKYISLAGPFGRCTLENISNNDDICIICQGISISTIINLLLNFQKSGKINSVKIYWFVKDHEQELFEPKLSKVCSQLYNVSFLIYNSRKCKAYFKEIFSQNNLAIYCYGNYKFTSSLYEMYKFYSHSNKFYSDQLNTSQLDLSLAP